MKKYIYILPLLPCLLVAAGCPGCHKPVATEEAHNVAADESASQYRQEMFVYSIDNLDQLEDFTTGDSFQELIEQLNPQYRATTNQPKVDPLLAGWPQPEMFRQIVDRLNRWVRAEPPPTGWKLDPMIACLPKALRDIPQLKGLDRMEFSSFDGFALQEAAWLRDVDRWAKGDGLDDLDHAQSLFDWTIRNIQLDPDSEDRLPQFPRETLLLGRGTASERASLFILLLRQLDIDAALLAVDDRKEAIAESEQGERKGLGASAPSSAAKEPGKPSASKPAKPAAKVAAATKKKTAAPPPSQEQPASLRPWCVGVLIEGQVYLFDPMLGLPIPGPDGTKLDKAGQLVVRPATLAQVAANDKLLRRMDYGESRVYPFRASDAKHATALLEASPPYLSRAMRAIQSQLTGSRKMVLATSPSESAKHWKAAKLRDVQLWTQPYLTLYVRARYPWQMSRTWLQHVLPLYIVYEETQGAERKKASMEPKGIEVDESRDLRGPRVVTHAAPLFAARVLYLKGKFTGDDGAIHFFQIARPSLQLITASSAANEEKLMKLLAKQDAVYWSGLLNYQQQNYSSAEYYFFDKTIKDYRSQYGRLVDHYASMLRLRFDESADGPWATGARYNLARTCEANKDAERAILFYRSDTASPAHHGELLRARWLEQLTEKQPAK